MGNGAIRYILAFSVGAAIGSVVTWKVLKDKYEKIANEEIESVRDFYGHKYGEKVDHKDSEEDDNKETIGSVQKQFYADYEETLKKAGYKDYTYLSTEGKPILEPDEIPYVIEPEAYGELEDYEQETLTYYADGVLSDDFDHPIENVNALVGADFADHFGEYEDDAVHVRNNRLKTDFEILRDDRPFALVTGIDVTADSEDE